MCTSLCRHSLTLTNTTKDNELILFFEIYTMKDKKFVVSLIPCSFKLDIL